VSGLSIRSRAVIAAALSIMLAVVTLGVAVDVAVERHLDRSLDSSLHRRAVAVAQLSASAPALLTTPGALESPLGGTDASVEVLDRHGRLVARSLGLGGRVLPAGALASRVIASGTPAFADATQAGDAIRLYGAPLADVRGPAAGGAVVVAASTTDLEDTLHALRVGVVLSALGAALLGGAAVALLLGRAFRPLRLLASSASEIERTADPGRRLPETGVDDEVGRLATTLNAMLGSLERSREAQHRLIADASHELRTPLTALQGNVDYLARHGATPELIADIREGTDRLARLAGDLIAISREEAAAPPEDEVALDRIVAALGQADRQIVVDAAPVRARGDGAALERAISNLVQNARVHGPPEGTITISTRRSGDLALVTVCDEGPGLDPADREHAFERFWRGEDGRSVPGSGLGLAIVRATAERHGGRAFAEGACFTIELPALRELSNSGATPEEELSEEGSP
jgi:two-component system sensor histidine kinase MprB